jgi:hypothetical protein
MKKSGRVKKIVSFEIRSAGRDSTALSWIGGMMNGNWGPILSFAVSSDASGYPFQDAVISQIHPDSVIDQSKVGNNILAYRERHDSELKRVMSYIKFDLRGTEGKAVEAARVSFRGALRNEAAEFENDFKVQLRGVTGEWEDNSITWNTRPTTPGAVLAEAALNTSSLRKDFINDGSRLVDFINEEIRKGRTSVTFEIRSAGRDSTDQMWLGGVLNGNFAPILDFSTPNLFGVSNDTLMAVQDTYVELSNPTQNFNGENKLLFRNQGDNNKEAWIKFDISNVKPGFGTVSMIVDGGLMIPEDVTTNLNQRIDLRRAANDWDETTLSWDNRPEVGGTLVNNFRINGDTTLVMTGMFLTKYLADSLSAGKQYISFVIRGRDGRAWDAFIASKDSIPARLAFDYTDDKQFVVEDVLVKEAEPDENFNTITSMDIRKATAEQDSKEALLKFSLANARSGFETAILNVRGDQQGATAADPREDFFIQVIGLQNTWAEDTTTWNNKPATVGNVLAEYNIRESKYHEIRSPALTEYIRNARRSGQEFVSLLIRGRDETPGHNAWISDKGWQPAFLNLDHRKLVANPVFQTNPGEYFPSVVVRIITPTEGAAIYYTLDGSVPNAESTLYVHADGISLTSSATVRAIAIKDGFADSDIIEAAYTVFPVSEPVFEPSPLVEYIDQVKVLLSAQPENALIFYSDDGSDPATPYNPEEGILLTSTTTIMARAIENVDEDPYISPVVEATYVVVNPVDGIGVGPAGVGFKDNTITGQPENALWLKADALKEAADGTDVIQWPDMSGNENHAYNTWVEGGNNAIANTAESQKRPPVFVENGINGMPLLRFGTRTGDNNDLSSLIIDDADNLDGGASISIFMVMKRNTMLADFASIIQKRDIRGSNTALQSYVLEMNGGADPHTIQFVLARNLFLRTPNQPARLFNADDFYLLNVELDGTARHATFRSNGEQLARSAYNNIVQNVEAPIILGGFQPMDVAEVIMYKSALNRAQRNIVHNYLAVKYNLEISDGENSLNVYSNQEYKFDMIGIGSETNPDGVTLGRHPSGSGAGLELAMSGSFALG